MGPAAARRAQPVAAVATPARSTTPTRPAPSAGARHVVPLTEIGAGDTALAGGKGANLGEPTTAGLPVPPGFVVAAQAYIASMEAGGVWTDLHAILSDGTDPADAAARLRGLVHRAGVADDVAEAIRAAYRRLRRRSGRCPAGAAGRCDPVRPGGRARAARTGRARPGGTLAIAGIHSPTYPASTTSGTCSRNAGSSASPPIPSRRPMSHWTTWPPAASPAQQSWSTRAERWPS